MTGNSGVVPHMIIGLAYSKSALPAEEQERRLRARRCSEIVQDDAARAIGLLQPGDTLVVADAAALGADALSVLASIESVAVMGATLVVAGAGRRGASGRPKADRRAIDDAVERYDAGEKVPEICAATGIGRSTLYRALAERGKPPDT